MRLLPVLLLLTTIEAKRRRLEKNRDDINRRIMANNGDPESFGGTMDFGHVYRNKDREEITNIEPDMIEPNSPEHARQLLRKLGRNLDDMIKTEKPLRFANPRDLILYNERINSANRNKNMGQSNRRLRVRPAPAKNVTQTIRESTEEDIRRKLSGNRANVQKSRPSYNILPPLVPKGQFFSKSSFQLVSDEAQIAGNWTKCSQFAKGAVFHAEDVINISWEPFFIWSMRGFETSVIHKFNYPTKKLVNNYKEEFGPYLDIKVDWEQPKLILKESREVLLIDANKTGLFYGITYFNLPSPRNDLNIKIKVLTIYLKIVDPYLAMMYCDDNYATIMSVQGTGPETDEDKTSEACILKFDGIGKPAVRDLEHESYMIKYEAELKQNEEEEKYINVERPADIIHPSLW